MQGQPPFDQQPPQYAAYPRQASGYGSPDRLRALADGYFGLNKVFLLNIILVFAARAAQEATKSDTGMLLGVLAGSVIATGVVVGFATYPFNKKIGYGANWSPSSPVIASLLMGLNSALCCGIVGYIVVQQLAAKEMAKYGLKSGFFGIKRKQIDAIIAQMQTSQQSYAGDRFPRP